MNPELVDALASSLRSRDHSPSLASSVDAWRAFAGRLLRARQALIEEPGCPPAVTQRVRALFTSRPVTAMQRIAEVVLDSWSSLAPAMRGRAMARLLRYECPTGAIDLQLAPPVEGRMALLVAVDGAPGATAVDVIDVHGHVTYIVLDENGTGRAEVEVERGPFTLAVCERGREVFRAHGITWRS